MRFQGQEVNFYGIPEEGTLVPILEFRDAVRAGQYNADNTTAYYADAESITRAEVDFRDMGPHEPGNAYNCIPPEFTHVVWFTK